VTASPATAQSAVVTCLFGTALLASIPSLSTAQWPSIRVVTGIAVAGTFLAFLAPVAPGPVTALSVLILTGSALSWGPLAIQSVTKAQQSATTGTAKVTPAVLNSTPASRAAKQKAAPGAGILSI
jgi:hypothetical protein